MSEGKKSLIVNVERLDGNIAMLKTYLDEEEINPFLSALERLKEEPESEAAMKNVVTAFNELGIIKGAVLNYATYLKVLLPQFNDSFGSD
ncbi:hypothetical protein [Kaarinaea lacus]